MSSITESEGFTRVTIQDSAMRVTVEIPREGLDIYNLVDLVIAPALHGMGYSSDLTDDVFDYDVIDKKRSKIPV